MRPSLRDGFPITVRTLRPVFLRLANSFSIDIPYPTPADRKELENLVKSNWDHYVQAPLTQTSSQASNQIHNAKEWIFDT